MSIKVKYIIAWSVLSLYVFVSAGFVARKSGEEVCSKVEISLTDTTNRLVIPRDITQLMEKKKYSVYGHKLSEINKMQIASLITENIALVRQVGIYRAVDGTLCINIEQREPILRVINKHDQGYYIDNKGFIFPLSNHWSARVLVANGDISEKAFQNRAIHIDSLYANVTIKHMTLQELLVLATYINDDEFLKAQIEQIYVKDNEYEMIPKVGSHIIYFGTLDNYVNKFFNLKAIYYKGFTNLGWQKYKAVNLKFENQVICTKR
jgi:cell division protein FtsQ